MQREAEALRSRSANVPCFSRLYLKFTDVLIFLYHCPGLVEVTAGIFNEFHFLIAPSAVDISGHV